MKSTGAQEVEWEILPPEQEARRDLEPMFRWLAVIMDNLLRVPGTKFRFGLDPLLGLLPGLGDTSSAVISAMALIQAARRGLPKILLARMALNILINETLGIVPLIGDAFSFWFKSNARNYDLLKRHSGGTRKSTRGDWIFVFAVVALLAILVAAGMLVSLLILRALAQAVGFQ